MSDMNEPQTIAQENAIPDNIVAELSEKVQDDILSKSLTDDEILDFLNEMNEQEFVAFMAYIDNFFSSVHEEVSAETPEELETKTE